MSRKSRKSKPINNVNALATRCITAINLQDVDYLRVPEECKTLNEAVDRVHEDDRLTTIVLGKGDHLVAVSTEENGSKSNTLKIRSAMNIVGDFRDHDVLSKKDVVVVGGIKFEEGIQGNCHLQHLTLHQAKYSGVVGRSSFTMEDVLVEQCGGNGVYAKDTGVVGRCTNVEVKKCGWSGVVAANGASITLIGAKTTVHDNCTSGSSNDYGLVVCNVSSTIQLVSLTKDIVSTYNGGGGNWGAEFGADINDIKTIDAAGGGRKRKEGGNGGNGGKTPKRPKTGIKQFQILRFG